MYNCIQLHRRPIEGCRKVAHAYRRNNTLRYFRKQKQWKFSIEFSYNVEKEGTQMFCRRNRTVTGWHAGESRITSAEGESGKPRISQAKGQR